MGALGENGGSQIRVRVPDVGELVAMICHEAGNALAGIRLSAHLISQQQEAEGLAALANDVDTLAVQAGALLAHVRPLMAEPAARPQRVAPEQILEALGRSWEGQGGESLRLVASPPGAVGDFLGDASALHHMLVTLIVGATHATRRGGSVRVSVRADAAHAVFVVEDDGESLEEDDRDPQLAGRGRHLALQIAAVLLRRDRGHLEVFRRSPGTRVELYLPLGSAS